ncbi:mucin-2-like [Daphnia carinata]|uniref:mucin-2-like n=1 Tax=Daphnia carinata TaxID=120202 RepID=UPI00257E416B|nr:mucin-2-like [Daphnia carinata]
MKTTVVMRIELIVVLVGLVCWMTAASQEIQPDEITTEWITTDAPVTLVPALEATTVRSVDKEITALPPNDLRARILLNSDFEDDPTQLIASQTGSQSAGSTLDNSLRSSNNNDWTPIVWASTRLVSPPLPQSNFPQATPFPSPVSVRPPPPGPSTLVIRPTPLLRPLPTILATQSRTATTSTERTISSSIRVPSTETPTATLPPVSSRPAVVRFDLDDASSGPTFTIIADPQANDSVVASSVPVPAEITPISSSPVPSEVTTSIGSIPVLSTMPVIVPTVAPVAATDQVPSEIPETGHVSVTSETPATGSVPVLVNQTQQLNDNPLLVDNSSLVLPIVNSEDVAHNATIELTGQLDGVEETFNATENSFANETFPMINETSTVIPIDMNSTDIEVEDNVVLTSSSDDGMANSSLITQPSNVLIAGDEETSQLEDVLTTPVEESPVTTDLSTVLSSSNQSSPTINVPSNSSVTDEANVAVLSTTESNVPSTSLRAAIMAVSTSDPVTTVTWQPEESTDQERNIDNGKGNREESGRSTTLSAGLATLFPALTRPPSTTVLPTETSKPITTSAPSTTLKTTTASAVVFTSSGWSLQPAPPTPSAPHDVNPLAGWPTTPNVPVTFHEPSVPPFYDPTSTEYYPYDEWPSTEGSQSGDEDSTTTTIVAVSVSIAAILCLAIAILLLLVFRRRRARAVQGTCQPARMDAYSLDNVSQSNTWQRGKVRNSLRASKRSYCNQAFDDSTVFSVPLTAAQLALYMEKPITSIEAEFRNIATSTVRIDELPVGVETKNRYANVLPVPETRVHIRVQDNQPADTIEQYINANYIKGPKEEPNFYIGCQGPMEETVEDFWQMIWENQCKIIVQLTDLSENGVSRCAEYLPPSEVLDCHRLYGDYQVTLKSRELRDNYVTSHIQLKRMEDNLVREITHLWYSSWPATGVPEDGKTIVSLLLEARKGQSKEQRAPMVVHCSPGTGRTGAVLAIDVCMRHLDSSRSIDIPRSVHRLRQDRAGCVQTGEQYAFIYKSVNYYASQLSNAALDSL